jgi:hypothetical protein
MRFPRSFLTFGIVALLATVSSSTQTVRLITRTYGPKSDLRISKPNLVWEAWPEGDDRITKVNASIDGKKLTAKYDTANRRVKLELDQPLDSGVHRVEMEMFINNWAKFRKEWSFRVLADSVAELPEPDSKAKSIIEEVNRIRIKASLEPFVTDARLTMSAGKHSEYLSVNNEADHAQLASSKGFIAESPSDRMEQFGFSDSSWEILATGIDDLSIGLQRLFDAPYHRVSFMQPGKLFAGGGFYRGCLVVDGQAASVTRTVLSPSDGQADIPTLWKDRESPDPMRFHRTGGKPTGYPIVYVHYTPDNERIQFVSASLKDEDGNSVPLLVNSPQTDDQLTNAVFLFAKEPMRPNHRYTVRIQAADRKDRDISRTWTFRTQAD